MYVKSVFLGGIIIVFVASFYLYSRDFSRYSELDSAPSEALICSVGLLVNEVSLRYRNEGEYPAENELVDYIKDHVGYFVKTCYVTVSFAPSGVSFGDGRSLVVDYLSKDVIEIKLDALCAKEGFCYSIQAGKREPLITDGS